MRAFVLAALTIARSQSACSDYTACDSCVDASEDLFDCEWCIATSTCSTDCSGSASTCYTKGNLLAHPSCTANGAPSCLLSPNRFDIPLAQCLLSAASYAYFPASGYDVSAYPWAPPTAPARAAAVGVRQVFESDDYLATLAAVPASSALILAFRGTVFQTWQEKITNVLQADGGSILTTNFQQRVNPNAPSSWQVAEGFATSYLAIQTEILSALETATGSSKPTLFITGHSLGSAMAVIAAMDIKLRMSSSFNDIRVMVFAPPRAGTAEFKAAVEEHFPDSKMYLFQNYFDQVPHVPPRGAGFLHPQNLIRYKAPIPSDDDDESSRATWRTVVDNQQQNPEEYNAPQAYLHYHSITTYWADLDNLRAKLNLPDWHNDTLCKDATAQYADAGTLAELSSVIPGRVNPQQPGTSSANADVGLIAGCTCAAVAFVIIGIVLVRKRSAGYAKGTPAAQAQVSNPNAGKDDSNVISDDSNAL